MLRRSAIAVARPGPAVQPLVVRTPLVSVADTLEVRPGEPCTACGGRGFTIHQRTWKQVKDPQTRRALVVRLLCKRCGHVRRAYPAGIGSSRQSGGLKHLSVLLYWIGISYQGVRAVLRDLGCPLSTTSVRRNVEGARRAAPLEPPLGRLRLEPVGSGMLRGADGVLALRVLPLAGGQRCLEAEIAPGPRGRRTALAIHFRGNLARPSVRL